MRLLKNKFIDKLIFFFFLLVFVIENSHIASAEKNVNKNILAEGSCAVVGMTAEQCQLLALQRARASAIEQASGVAVLSSTVVTNGMLAVDFIKTYSKGYVVNEKVEWLSLGQYQKDKTTAPIPEYRVKIVADVYSPRKKIKPVGLKAKLNSIVFKSSGNAFIDVKTARNARIAIFNITADDRVAMLFPNEYDKDNFVPANTAFKFPDKNSRTELVIETLPGHKRDAEAFFITVTDADSKKDFRDIFQPDELLSFSAFFKKYSEIADYCEDVIIAYEVVGE